MAGFPPFLPGESVADYNRRTAGLTQTPVGDGIVMPKPPKPPKIPFNSKPLARDALATSPQIVEALKETHAEDILNLTRRAQDTTVDREQLKAAKLGEVYKRDLQGLIRTGTIMLHEFDNSDVPEHKEAAKALRDAITQTMNQEHTAGGELQTDRERALSTVGQTYKGVMKVLDFAHKNLVRRPTEKLIDPSRPGLTAGFDDPDSMEFEEWAQGIKKLSDQGNPAAKTVWTLASVAGALASVPATALTGAAAVVSDKLSGRPTTYENMKDLVQSNIDSGAQLALGLGTDPLSFVNFTKSPTALVGKQVESLLAQSGKADAKALAGDVTKAWTGDARLSTAVGQKPLPQINHTALGQGGESTQAFEVLKSHLKNLGVKEDKITEQLGAQGQLLGRGKIAQSVIKSRLGEDAQLMRYLGLDPAVDAWAMRLRQARAGRNILEREWAGRAREMAKSWKDIPLARRIELIRHYVDPAFDRIKLKTMAAKEADANPAMKSRILARDLNDVLVPFDDAAPMPKFETISKHDLGDGEGLNWYAFNRAEALPAGSLAPHEAKAIVELKRLFEGMRTDLVSKGALGETQIAKNPLTGHYFPRDFRNVLNAFDEHGSASFKSWGFFKSREPGGGLPVGRVLMQMDDAARKGRLPRIVADRLETYRRSVEADPLRAVPVYINQSARKAQVVALRNELEAVSVKGPGAAKLAQDPNWIQTKGGGYIPKVIDRMTEQGFGDALATLSGTIAKIDHPIARPIATIVRAYERSISKWKRNVLTLVPGYHSLAIMNDAAQMLGSGMNNIPVWLYKARKLLSASKEGGAASFVTLEGLDGNQLMREMQQNGIAIGASERSQLLKHSSADLTDELRRIAEGKAPQSGLDRVLQLGDAVTEYWSDTSKAAVYLFRRSQGDSPAQAAKMVFDNLLDYGDRNWLQNVLRWAFPFFTYMSKAPVMATKIALRRPGVIAGSNRYEEAFTNGELEYVPPEYATELRGPMRGVGDLGRRTIGGLRQAFGGTDIAPATDLGMQFRAPFVEAFLPVTELSSNNENPMVQSLDPLLRTGIEWATGRDLTRKQPLARPTPMSMFYPGTFDFSMSSVPGLPGAGRFVRPLTKAFEADPGQNAYVARNFASFLFPSPVQWGVNEWSRRHGGSQILGGNRLYTDEAATADQSFAQLYRQLIGLPLHQTWPTNEINARLNSPRWTAATENAQSFKSRYMGALLDQAMQKR